MKLWKPLLFSTALLLSAPGCGKDPFTKEQAAQAVNRQYSLDQDEYRWAKKDKHFDPELLKIYKLNVVADSCALAAVEKGNYTVERGHPSGYDVSVRCATTTPDSFTTRVYHYFPSFRKKSKGIKGIGPFGESDGIGDND